MSILDRSQRVPFDRGSAVVNVLEASERVRLTVEARAAAVEASARLLSSGRFAGRAPLELARTIEAWILREEDGDVGNPTPL